MALLQISLPGQRILIQPSSTLSTDNLCIHLFYRCATTIAGFRVVEVISIHAIICITTGNLETQSFHQLILYKSIELHIGCRTLVIFVVQRHNRVETIVVGVVHIIIGCIFNKGMKRNPRLCNRTITPHTVKQVIHARM